MGLALPALASAMVALTFMLMDAGITVKHG